MTRRRTGPVRHWWRTRVRPWFQRNRADRWMPRTTGEWPAGVRPTVYLSTGLPRSHVDAMDAAIAWWRKRGVCLYTQEGPEFADAWGVPFGVVQVIAAPTYTPAAAHTEMLGVDLPGGTFERGEIRLHDVEPSRLLRACIHELGHVLGLGDRPGGDPALLMTRDRGATGCELLPEELEHARANGPR